MIIDMHNHTNRYSQCSVISPDNLIEVYINAKIDGICITEHDYLWEKSEQVELVKKYGDRIKIFFGVEVNTEIGHVLIFGSDVHYYGDRTSFKNLEKIVRRENAAMIWAHPFRWVPFSEFFITKEWLDKFDAIELYNGNLSEKQIKETNKILEVYNLLFTGGSDTHSFEMMLKYGTKFKNNFVTLEEMVDNLKKGNYKPLILNNLIKQ